MRDDGGGVAVRTLRPDERLLLKVPEAALVLGCSARRLYTLAATPGVLPDGLIVRLGRSIRISRPVLERWLGVTRDEEALPGGATGPSGA